MSSSRNTLSKEPQAAASLRYCVGIDCGLEELVCALLSMSSTQQVQTIAKKAFANSPSGFKALRIWAGQKSKQQPVLFVVEATGVYHEQVSVFLHDNAEKLAVVQPSRTHHHNKTLQVKTVTDMTAAVVIADYGLRYNPALWVKPNQAYMELRSLSRERSQLVQEKTRMENQLHALQHSSQPVGQSIKRLKAHIKFITGQLAQIETELDSLPCKDADLQEKAGFLTSIPGIGKLTAYTILGETQGFNGFTSAKQVVSYAGLDVVKKESGISVRSKSRISKRGNKNLRMALHFPALVAARFNEKQKEHFMRIVVKSGIKMKAYVAVQRKLLVLAFELCKKREYYNPNYIHQTQKESGRSSLTAPTVLTPSEMEDIAV